MWPMGLLFLIIPYHFWYTKVKYVFIHFFLYFGMYKYLNSKISSPVLGQLAY